MNDLLHLVKPPDVVVEIDVDAGTDPNGQPVKTKDTKSTKKVKSKKGEAASAETAEDSYEGPQDKQLESFYQEVNAIKELLMKIPGKAKTVEEHHERSKFVTRTDEVKKAKAAMQEEINEVQKLAVIVKGRLENLDKANAKAAQQKGCGPGSSSERTRTTITAALRKRLKESVEQFADLRERLNDEYREVVERRVFTVTGKMATDDEIERLIESGDAESIFQKAMLEQGRGHVLDTMQEIQERALTVKELEKSLLELHQIFLDMAALVEEQGAMLDNIEAQVQRSMDYVEKGTKELQRAKKYQKSSRKIMCAVFILFLIIALVVAIGVAVPMVRRSPPAAPAAPLSPSLPS